MTDINSLLFCHSILTLINISNYLSAYPNQSDGKHLTVFTILRISLIMIKKKQNCCYKIFGLATKKNFFKVYKTLYNKEYFFKP